MSQSLISWKNSEDPAPGIFSYELDPSGASQYLARWNRSETYWSTGLWNGQIYTGIPEMTGMSSKLGYRMVYVDNDKEKYLPYYVDNKSIITRFEIDVSGKMKAWTWVEVAQQSCLNNCSCTAYSYGTGCSVWFGDLINLQDQYSGLDGGAIYIRLAASELPNDHKKEKVPIPAVVSGGKLGTGAFGSVFKGVLPDSAAIAVKKLKGLHQDEKQFKAEVSTLGAIQHVNLVPLRGFCAEGTKRLLVLDFMPHGSLDSHLFHGNAKVLDWSTRYQIALGTARGLSYLHEKSRECIIHCDIKPENILLDAELKPKVADFDLAKLLGRNSSHVLTTLRGTIGYLAPEWISGLAITAKADVYSFGMMLLEIISGKRNTQPSENGEYYFPVEAAIKVRQGRVLSLLDERLKGNVKMDELNRACRVACWCIQEMESERPSMGMVVQILEGLLEVTVPPFPKFLKDLVVCPDDENIDYSLSQGSSCIES
ncbi:putative protein kinase RLK-Pelle-SD-2b family [Dioscorea sansibarensis]